MGVRKTFARLYRQNLARALMLLCGDEDPERALKDLMADLEKKTGLRPTLADCGAYFDAERPLLAPYGPEEDLRRAQAFAHQRAVKETDRATYQAMEALHPQPEHHALPGRGPRPPSPPSTTAWTPLPRAAW